MAWLHPLAGAVVAALLFWIGGQGLRARHRARYAAAARAAHRRWAPWMYGAVVAVALAGTGSVVALRPDLEVTGSVHFWVLWSVAALLTAGLVTSRSLPGAAWARRVHPWLGIAAMVGGLAGATLGLGLLP